MHLDNATFRVGKAVNYPLQRGLLVAILFAVGMQTGCQEHRISYSQFLAMQQQPFVAPESPAPDPVANQQTTERLNSNFGPYRVGSGDIIGLTVLGSEGAPLFPVIQTRVDRNGEVDLPLVGATAVADMELQDVEKAIHKKYVPGVVRECVVHAVLVAPETTNVLVVGAVTAPGLVPLRRTERNLLHAIVGAGGVTELASGMATLRRIRRVEEITTVNLTDAVQLAGALALDPLEPGDIVYVHAANPNIVYIGGLVNRPSTQTYPSGTERNILQALAAAGGVRTDVFPREGTLIRRMPDGKDVYVKLSLNRLATGKDPNIALAAGDILWVPETVGTRVQDWVNRNVFFRAGATVTYSATGVEYLNRPAQQSGGASSNLQDQFDPLGFLTRNTLLQQINQREANQP